MATRTDTTQGQVEILRSWTEVVRAIARQQLEFTIRQQPSASVGCWSLCRLSGGRCVR